MLRAAWVGRSCARASRDKGADPNKVVRITNRVAATALAGSVAQETFTTVAGPTYGTVYRGAAYVGHGVGRALDATIRARPAQR